jgi:hypothetical protein
MSSEVEPNHVFWTHHSFNQPSKEKRKQEQEKEYISSQSPPPFTTSFLPSNQPPKEKRVQEKENISSQLPPPFTTSSLSSNQPPIYFYITIVLRCMFSFINYSCSKNWLWHGIDIKNRYYKTCQSLHLKTWHDILWHVI